MTTLFDLPPPLVDRPIDAVPLAVVDVETTGLDPRRGDRVIEVAVLRVAPDGTRDLYASLINPGCRVDPRASAVNGIRDADLVGQPPFAQVIAPLWARLAGAVLVAHNAPFDLGFLAAEHQRLGLRLPETPVVDTLALARRWFRFGSNSLGAVARSLGIRSRGAHRAAGDVETTFAVFEHFVAELVGKGFATAGDFVRGYPAGVPQVDIASDLPEPLREMIALAVRERRAITIRYAGRDAVTERVVEPRIVQADALVAWCRLRGEERTFRLTRIRAVWWPGQGS